MALEFFDEGRAINDAIRLLAVRTIVLKVNNNDPIPKYDSLYMALQLGAFNFTNVANQYSQQPSSGPKRQPTSAPRVSKEAKLLFHQLPFFSLKKLVNSSELTLDANKNRTVRSVKFDLSPQELQVALGPNRRFLLFCGIPGVSPTQRVYLLYPNPVEIHVNNTQIKLNLRGIKGKPETVSPVDLTDLLRPRGNSLDVVYINTTENYHLHIFIAEAHSSETLLKQVLEQPHIQRALTVAEIQREYQTDDDEDMVIATSSISLRCPLSYTKMKYPTKGIFCNHIQCFDGLYFLQLQQQIPTWTCPICNKKLTLDHLSISDYYMEVLGATSSVVELVTLNKDGTWEAEAEVEDLDDDDAIPPQKQDSARPEEPIEIISLDSDSEDEAPVNVPTSHGGASQSTSALNVESIGSTQGSAMQNANSQGVQRDQGGPNGQGLSAVQLSERGSSGDDAQAPHPHSPHHPQTAHGTRPFQGAYTPQTGQIGAVGNHQSGQPPLNVQRTHMMPQNTASASISSPTRHPTATSHESSRHQFSMQAPSASPFGQFSPPTRSSEILHVLSAAPVSPVAGVHISASSDSPNMTSSHTKAPANGTSGSTSSSAMSPGVNGNVNFASIEPPAMGQASSAPPSVNAQKNIPHQPSPYQPVDPSDSHQSVTQPQPPSALPHHNVQSQRLIPDHPRVAQKMPRAAPPGNLQQTTSREVVDVDMLDEDDDGLEEPVRARPARTSTVQAEIDSPADESPLSPESDGSDVPLSRVRRPEIAGTEPGAAGIVNTLPEANMSSPLGTTISALPREQMGASTVPPNGHVFPTPSYASRPQLVDTAELRSEDYVRGFNSGFHDTNLNISKRLAPGDSNTQLTRPSFAPKRAHTIANYANSNDSSRKNTHSGLEQHSLPGNVSHNYSGTSYKNYRSFSPAHSQNQANHSFSNPNQNQSNQYARQEHVRNLSNRPQLPNPGASQHYSTRSVPYSSSEPGSELNRIYAPESSKTNQTLDSHEIHPTRQSNSPSLFPQSAQNTTLALLSPSLEKQQPVERSKRDLLLTNRDFAHGSTTESDPFIRLRRAAQQQFELSLKRGPNSDSQRGRSQQSSRPFASGNFANDISRNSTSVDQAFSLPPLASQSRSHSGLPSLKATAQLHEKNAFNGTSARPLPSTLSKSANSESAREDSVEMTRSDSGGKRPPSPFLRASEKPVSLRNGNDANTMRPSLLTDSGHLNASKNLGFSTQVRPHLQPFVGNRAHTVSRSTSQSVTNNRAVMDRWVELLEEQHKKKQEAARLLEKHREMAKQTTDLIRERRHAPSQVIPQEVLGQLHNSELADVSPHSTSAGTNRSTASPLPPPSHPPPFSRPVARENARSEMSLPLPPPSIPPPPNLNLRPVVMEQDPRPKDVRSVSEFDAQIVAMDIDKSSVREQKQPGLRYSKSAFDIVQKRISSSNLEPWPEKGPEQESSEALNVPDEPPHAQSAPNQESSRSSKISGAVSGDALEISKCTLGESLSAPTRMKLHGSISSQSTAPGNAYSTTSERESANPTNTLHSSSSTRAALPSSDAAMDALETSSNLPSSSVKPVNSPATAFGVASGSFDPSSGGSGALSDTASGSSDPTFVPSNTPSVASIGSSRVPTASSEVYATAPELPNTSSALPSAPPSAHNSTQPDRSSLGAPNATAGPNSSGAEETTRDETADSSSTNFPKPYQGTNNVKPGPVPALGTPSTSFSMSSGNVSGTGENPSSVTQKPQKSTLPSSTASAPGIVNATSANNDTGTLGSSTGTSGSPDASISGPSSRKAPASPATASAKETAVTAAPSSVSKTPSVIQEAEAYEAGRSIGGLLGIQVYEDVLQQNQMRGGRSQSFSISPLNNKVGEISLGTPNSKKRALSEDKGSQVKKPTFEKSRQPSLQRNKAVVRPAHEIEVIELSDDD